MYVSVCETHNFCFLVSSYLVTSVKSKDDGQHAGGRVATMMLCPMIMDVLKEDWIHNQNLHKRRVSIVKFNRSRKQNNDETLHCYPLQD